jgi:hypothetical protein
VSIDGEPLADDSLAARYPFIPPDARADHQRAVDEIRQLGGHVDVEFRRLLRPYPELVKREWATIVYLSDDWRGGDAGLANLARLYNLRDVQLVGAEITDEGLKQLCRVENIKRLDVVETQVTSAGLAEIADLKHLLRLRLEGSVGGGQLDDDALKHLRGHPTLEFLELYGRGFSDAGLSHLRQTPELEFLKLYDTAMTKDALNAFQQERDRFTWQEFAVTGITRPAPSSEPPQTESELDASATKGAKKE